MKLSKAPGQDGFPVECLKKGSMAVLEWLVTVEQKFPFRVLKVDWHRGCIVPLYKGKGVMYVCSNLRY